MIGEKEYRECENKDKDSNKEGPIRNSGTRGTGGLLSRRL